MKQILATLAVLAMAAAVGCHAQVPPSPPPQVTATWSCASCTGATTYVVSVATISGSTCPAVTGTNYVQQGTTAAGVLTLTWTPAVDGVTICAIVQAQVGGLTGQPSAPSAPYAIPPYPGTPTAPAVN